MNVFRKKEQSLEPQRIMSKITYITPTAELIELSQGLNLLSSMSIYGDINDYEEGGDFSGVYTDASTL